MVYAEILNKFLTGLGWFFNPKATKERELKKIKGKLKSVEDMRELARVNKNNDLYAQKTEERNEILKEMGRISNR